MKPWVRWAILAGSVVVLVVLFVVLRPDDATEGASPTPPTTPTGSPSGTPTQESPSPSPEPAVTLIEVTYRDGAVQGPTTRQATQGDDVRLVVRTDVADEVHLHGYDLSADVAPGQPARIDFVADAAGVFEVELEEAGTLLIELEIVP